MKCLENARKESFGYQLVRYNWSVPVSDEQSRLMPVAVKNDHFESSGEIGEFRILSISFENQVLGKILRLLENSGWRDNWLKWCKNFTTAFFYTLCNYKSFQTVVPVF